MTNDKPFGLKFFSEIGHQENKEDLNNSNNSLQNAPGHWTPISGTPAPHGGDTDTGWDF